MFTLHVSLLLILAPLTYACTPTLIDTIAVTEGQICSIQCSVQGNAECTSVIESMVWEKEYGNNEDKWDDIVRMSKDGSTVEYFSPNTYSIESRSFTDLLNNIYDITITSAIIQDSWNWRCKVVGNDGKSYTSVKKEQIVQSLPTSLSVTVTRYPEKNYLVLTASYEYRCSVAEVYPRPTVKWELNGVEYSDETDNDVLEGYVWNVQKMITLAPSVNTISGSTVTCHLIYPNVSEPNIPAELKTPPIIETLNVTDTAPTLDTTLKLTCIVSGDDVTVFWLHKGVSLNASLFKRSDSIIRGEFAYDQTTAVESVLTWIAPTIEDSSRSNITRHNGTYTCRGSGLEGTFATNESEGVSIQYPPVGDGEPINLFLVTEGGDVNVECPINANPPIHTYEWRAENKPLRSGISGSTDRTLVIQDVNDDDFDTIFICNCSNPFGSGEAKVQLTNAIISSTSCGGGCIAGIVCGILAIVVICIVIGLFYYKKKNRGSSGHVD